MNIQNFLANCFIHLINPRDVITGFHCMGILNCMGAVDDTHIPTICLPQGAQVFINQKGYFSVILQGIIDHQICFTYIFTA